MQDNAEMPTHQGLDTLSDDLLLDIMQLVSLPSPGYLGPTRQRNDLLPFMRCSRRLYRLGEPILYRKLIATTSKTLRGFIKTILAHPDLADHVRAVILTDEGPAKTDISEASQGQLRDISQGDMSDIIPMQVRDIVSGIALPLPRPRHFNPEELETIEAVIISLSPEKAPLWMKGVSDGAWTPLAALALCLLPNIEDLQIEKCQHLRWQNLGPTRNLLSYRFPFAYKPTAKLRNISISYDKRTGKDGLFAIPVPLLALPTLRTFSGDMMRESFWKNTTLDTKFSIKSLRLDRCNFSPTALENLLNSCPNLEFLKYEHDEEKQEHPFRPGQFEDALVNLKAILKELVLYRTALEPRSLVTAQDFEIIKSLKEFQKLTRIFITAHLLLGPQKMEGSRWYEASRNFAERVESQPLASCLPPSLEHLKLKNCGVDIFEQVTGLMEAKEVVVPNLKSLIIEFVHLRNHHTGGRRFITRAWSNQLALGTSSQAVRELDGLCKKKGVMLDVWYN